MPKGSEATERHSVRVKLRTLAIRALDKLCSLGCDREELWGRFEWLLRYKAVTLKRKKTLVRSGEVVEMEVQTAFDPRPLDRRNTAHPGFSLRRLKSIAKRAGKLKCDVVKLRRTPMVGHFVDSGILPEGDLLAGSPLNLSDLRDPFRGLEMLPMLAKECGPQKHPDQTRARKAIHRYIHEQTGRWHDDLFAAIYNDLFPKEQEDAKHVERWRARHMKPSPKRPL